MGYKRHKRGREGDALVLRLPTLLISDILSRLPIESIFSCRCVCKTLIKILSDPYFAELHLTNAPGTDQRLIIQNNSNASCLFLFHMFDFENISSPSPQNSNHQDCDPRPWKTMVLPSVIKSQTKPTGAFLVGSCNGLLCLACATKVGYMLYVCNPILGEFLLLPQAKPQLVCICAFGFCPRTKQYKVIRFISHSSSELHTVGTNYWKMIENVRSPVCRNFACLNGNLHWVADGNGFSERIWSFNLEAERVLNIPSLSHFYERHFQNRFCHLQVGSMGGLLCVGYLLDRVQFEVFVLKDYGAKDSWTKLFTICVGFSCGLATRIVEASWFQFIKNEKPLYVQFLGNGDLLIQYLGFPLVYYSPRKGRGWDIMELGRKERVADMLFGTYDGSYYVPSFISLEQIVKGKNVKFVTPKKSRNIWSSDKVQLYRNR